MAYANLFNTGKFIGRDANGNPVAYGKLRIEDTNGNLATIYTDSTMSAENTNPVILSANGEADVYLLKGLYNITLYDRYDVVVWNINNYYHQSASVETDFSDILEDFVVEGLIATTSGNLTTTISEGSAYIQGEKVIKTDEQHTFTASKDTYVDLDNTGVYHYTEVNNGDPAPSVYTNSIRLFKVVSDATSIITIEDLRNLKAVFNRDVEATNITTTNINGTSSNPVNFPDNIKVDSINSISGSPVLFPDFLGVDYLYDTNGSEILHSDGTGIITMPNQSAVSVYMGANQTIASGTWTKLNFNTVIYDVKGEFDTINYRFIASKNGIYFVNGVIMFYNSDWAGYEALLWLYKNGISIKGLERRSQTTGTYDYMMIGGSVAIYLNAGDYLELFVYQNTGSNHTVYAGSSYTTFNIHKLA